MIIMVYCVYFTDAISNINFKINVHVFAFLFYHFVKLLAFCKIELSV